MGEPRPREIRVTQRDIDASRRLGAKLCPLERGFRRAGYRNATVGTMHVLLDQLVALPDDAILFVEDFDRGYPPVVPETFVIPIPGPVSERE